MTAPAAEDASAALAASIVHKALDLADRRLDLTREALRAALCSDLQYRLVLSGIERAVNDGAASTVE